MKKSFIRVLSVLLAMILASAVLVACDIGGSKKDKKDKDKDSDTSKTFDVDTMQADLEEAGYLVSTEPVGEDSLYEGAEHVLVALLDDYRISVYFFDTKANAKTAHEQMKEAFDIIGEDFDFKLKGNIIYAGSEKAIQDAGIESTTTRPNNKPNSGIGGNEGVRDTEGEEDYFETVPENEADIAAMAEEYIARYNAIYRYRHDRPYLLLSHSRRTRQRNYAYPYNPLHTPLPRRPS